jgi:lipopolysaccharide export LptBFGC system permease protein LptF
METDLVDEGIELQKRRGKNLPVFCTLSFISIGLGTIGFLLRLMGSKKTAEEMFYDKQDLLSTVPDNASLERITLLKDYFKSLEFDNDNFYVFLFLKLALLIIGFFGVLMMYKLKKTGFYLYLVYSAVAIGLAVWVMMASDSNTGAVGAVFTVFIAILFSIIYAAQLKRMV